MKYNLFKTAKKTAKENNLIEAVSRYYDGNNLFYDFSLFEELKMSDDEKQAIISDTMEHHAISWYSQPLPTICNLDRFTGFYGQITTAAHRVYKSDGRRIMVIIEIIAVNLEKQSRRDVWSEYKTEATYTAKRSGFIGEDYEIA